MLQDAVIKHIPKDKTNQGDSSDEYSLTSADCERTLQELEGSDWREPEYGSHLVTTCHRLRRTPLQVFTVEDLRIMIGQGIGLPWLVPLALERLEEDPLVEGDYYPGDLLGSVLGIEAGFWRNHPDLRNSIEEIIRRSPALPKELQDRLAAFNRPDPDKGGAGAKY